MPKPTRPKEKLVFGQRVGQLWLLAAPITLIIGFITGNNVWFLYPPFLIYIGVLFRAWGFVGSYPGVKGEYTFPPKWKNAATNWQRAALILWTMSMVGAIIWLLWIIVSKFI